MCLITERNLECAKVLFFLNMNRTGLVQVLLWQGTCEKKLQIYILPSPFLTYVRSRTTRITHYQSWFPDLFKNTSYLCPVRESRATRISPDLPRRTRTSPTWSLPLLFHTPFQKHLLPVSGPVLGVQSHQDHAGSLRTNQGQSYIFLVNLDSKIFSKTPPNCVRSSPGILEPPGKHRTTQDQSYKILAFLTHIFSKKDHIGLVLGGPVWSWWL